MTRLPPLPVLSRDRAHMTAVFFLVLLVYALSASHRVGLEDDGMFILSSWNGGVSHPPGYPL